MKDTFSSCKLVSKTSSTRFIECRVNRIPNTTYDEHKIKELWSMKRKSNSLSVKDLLWDNVVETAFPNVQHLMKIYVLMPLSEATVEREFCKMGKIMTKKHTALDDNSSETLMHISKQQQSLNTNDVKHVLELWRNQKERRIFSSDS